jgi:hypothetical protein
MSNHIIHHGVIAFIMQMALYFTFQNVLISFLIPTMFYFLRELYQYYVQKKTHNGIFDYWGALSPVIVNFVTAMYLL